MLLSVFITIAHIFIMNVTFFLEKSNIAHACTIIFENIKSFAFFMMQGDYKYILSYLVCC